jgi:hypothetical protein
MEERAEMGTICAHCPVQTECAKTVVQRLQTGRIVGGFYAGVWLPWPPSATPASTSTLGRRRALDALRQKALDTEPERVLAGQHQYVGGRG